MLYKWGELSLVECYLKLHPHLVELTPTHPFQLMVTRALMVLGAEYVDGFEEAHWSAAWACGFGQLDLKSNNHLAPAILSKFLNVYLHSVLLDWDPTPYLFSYLLPMLPFGYSVVLPAFREEHSPFDISVSVHLQWRMYINHYMSELYPLWFKSGVGRI